jgi:hypothetical protein
VHPHALGGADGTLPIARRLLRLDGPKQESERTAAEHCPFGEDPIVVLAFEQLTAIGVDQGLPCFFVCDAWVELLDDLDVEPVACATVPLDRAPAVHDPRIAPRAGRQLLPEQVEVAAQIGARFVLSDIGPENKSDVIPVEGPPTMKKKVGAEGKGSTGRGQRQGFYPPQELRIAQQVNVQYCFSLFGDQVQTDQHVVCLGKVTD